MRQSMPKVGIYICHCGTNIAGKVDVEEVAQYARDLPHVESAWNYKFMCSDPGQQMIIEDIKDKGLNRVVVASCSTRMHERPSEKPARQPALTPTIFRWPASGSGRRVIIPDWPGKDRGRSRGLRY